MSRKPKGIKSLCVLYVSFLVRCHKQWGKGCGHSKYVYLIPLSAIIGKAKKSAGVLMVKGEKNRKRVIQWHGSYSSKIYCEKNPVTLKPEERWE